MFSSPRTTEAKAKGQKEPRAEGRDSAPDPGTEHETAPEAALPRFLGTWAEADTAGVAPPTSPRYLQRPLETAVPTVVQPKLTAEPEAPEVEETAEGEVLAKTDPAAPDDGQEQDASFDPHAGAIQAKAADESGPDPDGAVQAKTDPEEQPEAEEDVETEGEVQPKLEVSPPDDPLEAEADRVADRAAAGGPPEDEEPTGTCPARIQRTCVTCGGAVGDDGPCEACAVQRKARAPSEARVPRPVRDVIASPGPGRPLAPDLRARIEPVLAADLSAVRVHAGSAAASASDAIGARAFTHGQNIWLSRGESPADTRLMAHEATHTVQQAKGTAKPQAIQRSAKTDELRSRLEDDDETAAIELMGELSEAEAQQVLRDASMRGLAVDAFWDSEMQYALMAAPGDLWDSLIWAFSEGTNWDNVLQLLRNKAETVENSIIRSTWMRDHFVSICGDAEMLTALDYIGGPLHLRLGWLEAEGNGWSDVKGVLEAAEPTERVKLYAWSEVRDHFVSICYDFQMREAVRIMGGPLVDQLLWLKAEDAAWSWFRSTIVAAPREERPKVYDNAELMGHFQSLLGDYWMRQLVNYLGGPLSNQMEALRGEGSDYAPRAAEEPPGRATRDEALMAQLEDQHHLYAANQRLERAESHRTTVAATPAGLGERPTAQEMTEHSNDVAAANREVSAARSARDAELRASPYRNMAEFQAAQDRFKAFFQGYALQTAHQMLRENRRLVEAEQRRYDPSGEGTTGIFNALEPAREKYAEAQAASRRAGQIFREHGQPGKHSVHWLDQVQRRRYEAALATASGLFDETRILVHGQARAYPILADRKLTQGIHLSRMMEADATGLAPILHTRATQVLENIDDVRENLRSNSGRVWAMQPVIAEAKRNLGIQQGSIFESLITDAISENAWDDIWVNLALAALAIGLGLLSGGIGTAAVAGTLGVSTGVVAGTAAVGGLALSAYSVSQSYDDYSHGMAAANTAFEQARSVAASEPSMLWLAIDIVGLGLDLGGAVKAFRALSGPAHAAAAAEDAADAARLIEELRTAARQCAGEAGAGADELAEAVTAAALRQQERAKVLAKESSVSAIDDIARAAGVTAEEIGEVAQAGLVRLEPGLRGAVLDALRGRPALIQEFGAFAEANQGFISNLDALRGALPPEHFGGLLGDLMLRRDNNQLLLLLDGLRSGDIGPDDVRGIANAMAGAESAGGRTRAFDEQMAALLGRNADEAAQEGVKTMDSWLASINPETRARIEGNPDLYRLYSEMDPRVRRMLTLCASPCVALSPPPTPGQINSIEAVYQRLGLPDDHEGVRALLHGRAGDEMDRAIAALEEIASAKAGGQMSDALATEILGSPGLRRVMTEYDDGADQLIDLWTDWRARQSRLASNTFTEYVGHRGLRTAVATRRPPIALADVIGAAAGQDNATRNLALIRRNVGGNELAPRLADAIENGTFPDHLMQRIRRVLARDYIGTSTFADGPRSRLVREINDILSDNVRDVNELRHVLDHIDQPSSRGRIGEAFANRNVLGRQTGAVGQARFPDVPGATRNPVIADNIRPAGRTVDVKTGYNNTDIDLDQLRNYERLRAESQNAASAVNRQLRDQFGVANGQLTGSDYLFLPGGSAADQSARVAARRALTQIQNAGLGAATRVYYVDNIGRLFELTRSGGQFNAVQVAANTLGL